MPWVLVAKPSTSYTTISKPTVSSGTDGAYTEVGEDGAYTESGPGKFGIPDGAWTESGEGWTPVFPPESTTYSLVAKPS